ncbi:DUF4157 domain-containing protein [Pseudomonas syringae]|uniref:eCIS core domain-containing protein n=1 Tax=Pseudomonas syringae TaxID=317 RepID=UPI001CA94055|nr:DUF4157 domain-containing protein [Pseudomonas syringae]
MDYDHEAILITLLIEEGHRMDAPLQSRHRADNSQTRTAKAATQGRVLVDNRPSTATQRKLTKRMNNSPLVLQQQADSARMWVQPHEMNGRLGGAIQLQENSMTSSELPVVQRQERPNATGLPDQLKSGIESLSGVSMDRVRVHYNSGKPAQLQAHAYTQGHDIHVGPGQERYLPHESWHVVQQAQGRVKPTVRMKGHRVNDDAGLEREADVMGGRALASGSLSAQRVSIQNSLRHLERPTGTHVSTQLATPEAQKRAFHATRTISVLAAGFDAAKAHHLFDGVPMAGGTPGTAPPTGLHGYRNGALPGNITEINKVGNRNKRHQISWKWTNPVGAANSGTKSSTMFPAFITENRLKALIALAHPDWAGVQLPAAAYPSETRDYIMLGAPEIRFNTHGDTVYPD